MSPLIFPSAFVAQIWNGVPKIVYTNMIIYYKGTKLALGIPRILQALTGK
jgi:hypothetical protein